MHRHDNRQMEHSTKKGSSSLVVSRATLPRIAHTRRTADLQYEALETRCLLASVSWQSPSQDPDDR